MLWYLIVVVDVNDMSFQVLLLLSECYVIPNYVVLFRVVLCYVVCFYFVVVVAVVALAVNIFVGVMFCEGVLWYVM